jgi:hypothetical protein
MHKRYALLLFPSFYSSSQILQQSYMKKKCIEVEKQVYSLFSISAKTSVREIKENECQRSKKSA